MENHIFPAHIRIDPATGFWQVQSNCQHARNVAEFAENRLRSILLGRTAYLVGLLHDAGKEKPAFEKYIVSAAKGEGVRRGSVNHSFAGARYILRRWHRNNGATLEDVAAELLAYSAGAHHGLFDCVGDDYLSGFEHRMTAGDSDIEESIHNFLKHCTDEKELDMLFSQSFEELQTLFSKFQHLGLNSTDLDFFLGMTARMLLSAVIDGDRRDTAIFMRGADYPKPQGDMSLIWQQCLERVEKKINAIPSDSNISQARHKISTLCRNFAREKGGIYRLSVPTGSGKTLSALRYALAHAAQYNKQRILFVSPLLTILDQNALVIRQFIQDDSIILEHHSNLVLEEDEEKAYRTQLLTENWGAPIIITTLFQLLNTMFSGKTSAVRRFCALCDSVIVIDEIQSVPTRMLSQFNMAINYLAECCGATVILCSATQPCLEAANHPLLHSPREIVPYDAELWKAFRRTELHFAGRMKLADIPQFAAQLLSDTDSLLIVCNKKDQAECIYRELSKQVKVCLHLSAAMCPAHRKKVLDELGKKPKSRDGEKIVCVSTQVIEAGVDISFGCVVRLCAGMDNVIQAVGRCNRNCESQQPAPVYLVDCLDENLGRLPDIMQAKAATTELLERYSRNSAQFDDDLQSDKAISWYYRRLYSNMPAGFQDYTLPAPRKHLTQYSLLSDNGALADPALCPACGNYYLQQAFKLAGDSFQVFDTDTVDVIVPYGDGKRIIIELNSYKAKNDLEYATKLIQAAKEYTVALYGYQRKKLEREEGLFPVLEGEILALKEGYYDSMTGFTMHDQSSGYEEV